MEKLRCLVTGVRKPCSQEFGNSPHPPITMWFSLICAWSDGLVSITSLAIQFSQSEITFSVSTRCLCICLFCQQVGVLCSFNVQICMLDLVIQIQNTIQNTILWPWQFESHTLQNHDLTQHLSIIITGLVTPNFACNVQEYFKDGKPKSNCQFQNVLCDTHSDI